MYTLHVKTDIHLHKLIDKYNVTEPQPMASDQDDEPGKRLEQQERNTDYNCKQQKNTKAAVTHPPTDIYKKLIEFKDWPDIQFSQGSDTHEYSKVNQTESRPQTKC